MKNLVERKKKKGNMVENMVDKEKEIVEGGRNKRNKIK
jgi:hypothetical protein